MAYAGIDYGLGQANVDRATGIRFGVISQNSVLQAWADSSEPEYGEPTCGECGNTAIKFFDANVPEEDQEWDIDGHDYACHTCKRTFDSEDAFGDEPAGYSYEGEGYKLTDCLDSDIFILKSPYYTFAQFCSPCVPGAGNLDNPCTDGPKTYALGHDWFEDQKAPYPVYSVETGELVNPEQK
jgi:hypothetical protein